MAKNKPILNADTTGTLDTLNPSISKGSVSDDKTSKPDKTNDFVSASEMKDEKLPKNVTNVSKVAELVGDVSTSLSGTGGPTLKATRAISFSGAAESIIGDRSASVIASKANRSGGRPERKLDTALNHVDDTPAETYKVPVKTIPDIKSNDPIGYNGVYRNEHSISGKGSGGSPKDSDFFRTVDMMEYDTMYWTHGQNNFQLGDSSRVITVKSYNKSTESYDESNKYLGNYTNDKLTITFRQDANGRAVVNNLQFSSTDHSRVVDESTYRLAGDAALRNEHVDELDRLAMVDKAGDENKDNFSPLGMAIPNASAANRMLKMLDSIVGSYVGVAGDKLGKALSFQINKTAKDGIRKVGPMFEMCLGNVDSVYNDRLNTRLSDWTNENANILTELFGQGNSAGNFDPSDASFCKGKAYNAKGSAALYVAYHDSLAKYNTKAKLLSLPLSFKTAYSSFKANSGIFKTTDIFAKEYARQEVFGKVDEDGTGITPVFMSDGVKLITPLPLSAFGTVTPGSNDKPDCALTNLMVIHFEQLRNKYNYDVYNFLTQGLIDYFNRHANRIWDFLPKAVDGAKTLEIPVISTQQCLSLWDLVLCEALPDIVRHRKYAMQILNEYEDMNGYPYSGLVNISELVTPNVGFTDINSTLSTKNIPLTTAVRIIMPEVFATIGDIYYGDIPEKTGNKYQVAKVILPWYFSQNQFEDIVRETGTTLNPIHNHIWNPVFMEGSRMTFFDRRDGVSWSNVDRVLDLDPEQLKLAMDRMVVYPGTQSIPDTGNNTSATPHDARDSALQTPCQVYKHATHDDGIPIVNYNAYAGATSDAKDCLTIDDIIAVPRELGLSFIAPDGVVTPTKLAYINGNDRYEYQHYRSYSDGYLSYSGPGFRAYLWAKFTAPNTTDLSDPQIDRTAGAVYSAHYYTIYSNPYDSNKDIGLLFNINAQNETNHQPNGSYIIDAIDKPIAQIDSNTNFNPTTGLYGATESKVTTAKESTIGFANLSKYLWNRLNILPFIINPFDINVAIISATSHANNKWRGNYKFDPFEFIYLFNVCGLRCGEYSTSEYERCESRIQRGLGYTEDPYIQRRL